MELGGRPAWQKVLIVQIAALASMASFVGVFFGTSFLWLFAVMSLRVEDKFATAGGECCSRPLYEQDFLDGSYGFDRVAVASGIGGFVAKGSWEWEATAGCWR